MNGCDMDLDLIEVEMVRNSPFVPSTSRGKTGESPSWPKDRIPGYPKRCITTRYHMTPF